MKTKFKNKLIILDNASSHRNESIKNLLINIIIYYIMFHINILQIQLKIILVC
jgi:hypothetical protein